MSEEGKTLTHEQILALTPEEISKFTPEQQDQIYKYLRENVYRFERPKNFVQEPFNPANILKNQYAKFGDDETQWAAREKPAYTNYNALKAQDTGSYNAVQWKYKRDEDEQGFGPGVDDLARILLDNQSVVKYNKKLTTRAGALYWVDQRNKGKPERKHWSVVVYDLNNDKIPEVLILDAHKNIRYINGYHVGKKNILVDRAHQEYIEKFHGNPSSIQMKRLEGAIGPGDLSKQYWMENIATKVDPNNPLGPLTMSPELEATGYKTRPMNPCNLFMKYVTKRLYDPVAEAYDKKCGGKDTRRAKMVRKLASIIVINAECYNRFVGNPVFDALKKEGYSEKKMRTRFPGTYQTPFSKQCARQIKGVIGSADEDKITALIQSRFEDAFNAVSQQVDNVIPKKHIDLRKDYNTFEQAYYDSWLDTPYKEK